MAQEDVSIEKAIGRFLDGELEPEDGPVLARAIAEDCRIAEELRRLLIVDGLLHQAADVDPGAFAESVHTRLAAEEDGARFTEAVSERLPTATPARDERRRWLPWAISALACLGAAVSLICSWMATESTPPQAILPDAVKLPIAVMVNEEDARFAENASPVDGHFIPGKYYLQAGTVHLRFSNGAEVVMRSPAQFTIMDPMNMALTEGALRAIVPNSAHGFSVHAADIRYEDLGTEFGVSVGKQPGDSQLHVFEGRVDLKSPQGTVLSSVEEGESVSVTSGKVEKTDLKHLDVFPTAAMIGMGKWLSWRERVEKDPSLICYYPFIPEPADRTLLKDHAFNRPAQDGHIKGARWVTGRWPGKQALLFDRDGDHVHVDVPGQFRHLTFSAWIYLDRCDFALNAILDSDGWRPGALHCQLSRTGEFVIGHWGKPPRKKLGLQVMAGRWTHVAVAIDFGKKESRSYLNGELSEKVKFAAPEALTPGSCRIGDWLRHPEPTTIPNRGFRGRIDELVMWNRVLPPEEIREMVVAGRSSLASAP
jgi:hypothetical protein